MFTHRFSEDNFSISYNLQEIERVKFRIEGKVLVPKYEQWLEREVFIRTAYSSTMVEDATISEDEMEAIVRQSPIANIPPERPDVVNYGKALEFIDFINNAKIPTDESVIRQIHWHLMKDIKDTQLKPGQYRTQANWIEHEGVKVYDPPFYVHLPTMMVDFSDWLKADGEIQPIIKAGIAHVHLVALHPFVDGNGRTARLLALLLLRQGGYGFRKLLSLDSYYQNHRNDYISALHNSFGDQFNEDYDMTPWLEFFTTSVLMQAKWLEQKLTDWAILIDKAHRTLKPWGLSDRQIDGLTYAMRVGFITRKDYMEITNVSPLTATRDLVDLVNRGQLIPKGTGRNRKYYIRQQEQE